MENESGDSNPNCETCKDRKTKYRCVVCKFPVCNPCASSVDQSVSGYNEENKMVGMCKSCDSVSETTFTTSSSDAEVIRVKEDMDDKVILVRQKSFSSASEPSRKNIGLDFSL